MFLSPSHYTFVKFWCDFWGHVGVILLSCWGHFGVMLGSFLVPCWDHFGGFWWYLKGYRFKYSFLLVLDASWSPSWAQVGLQVGPSWHQNRHLTSLKV